MVAMLQAFLDDSGSEDTATQFVLAGYVSTVEQWKRFSPAWQAALDQSPRIPHFKANEALGARGVFAGMSPDEVWTKVGLLTQVIADHVAYSVVANVYRIAYEKTFDLEKIDHRFHSPYYPCFYSIVSALESMPVDDGPVTIVFDKQRGLGPRALEMVDALSSSRVRTVSFGDDKSLLPLQAADLCAWRFRRRSQFGRDDCYHEPCWHPLHNVKTIGRAPMPGYQRPHLSFKELRSAALMMEILFPPQGPGMPPPTASPHP